MSTRAILLTLTLFLLGLQGCTIYPTHTKAAVSVHEPNMHLKLVFTDYDRRYIQSFYGHRKPYGKVPPGHYKRYSPHKPLPSQYRPVPIPRELDRRLTPLPAGYIRVMIGNDLAIMNTRTRVLYDIIWQIR